MSVLIKKNCLPCKILLLLSFMILFTACDNRELDIIDVFEDFTIIKEAPDSLMYQYPEKSAYADTLRVGNEAKYTLIIKRSSECQFTLNFDTASSECSFDPETCMLRYKALSVADTNKVTIDITDPWNQKKTVFIYFTSLKNLAPVIHATIEQKFIPSGYEITIDARKSADPDSGLNGTIVLYEFKIGNQEAIQTTSPTYTDTLDTPLNYVIKVRAKDNEEEWGAQNYSFNVGLTDVENNIYPVVFIGDQVWMAADLMATKFADNTDIPDGSTNSILWSNQETGAYSKGLGILYSWYAVTCSKNICPSGWHVPSKLDWGELVDPLGNESNAGKHLKNSNWKTGAGDNSSGFSAGYTGYVSENGVYNSSDGVEGYWWSTSISEENSKPICLHLSASTDSIDMFEGLKTEGYAVRCLRDN